MSYIRKNYPIEQLREYSQLFSRSELIRFAMYKDYSSVNYCIESYDNRAFSSKKTYGTYYKYLYKVLLHFYNNEYIFKNEFIKYLSKNLSGDVEYSLYSELNIGSVIVDLALFNGKSVGFEIKTELDNPSRLYRQVDEYFQIFNEVYLIVPSSMLDLYRSYCTDQCGIIVFDKNQRTFSKLINSGFNDSPNPNKVMQVLRTEEYRQIVKSYFGDHALKNTTDFTQFDVCSKLIKKIPPKKLNELFIDTLKKRRSNLHRLPYKYSEFSQALVSFHNSLEFKKSLLVQLNNDINF